MKVGPLRRSAGGLAALVTMAALFPLTPARAGPQCHGRAATIVGTNGADRIRGTSDSDVIVGLDGVDRIDGRGGRDYICGNDGNDVLSDSGSDLNDDLDGGAGSDTITGQSRVMLKAFGNTGVAGYPGTYGHKTLFSIENVDGTPGADFIGGSPSKNKLNGFEGDDHFIFFSGEANSDTWNGGAGKDTIDFSRAPGEVFANLELGTAQVAGSSSFKILGFEDVVGSYFDDNLVGDSAANVIRGSRSGVSWDGDVIDGGAGDDNLSAPNGPSAVSGGDGNDSISTYGFPGSSVAGDGGNDNIRSGIGSPYDATGYSTYLWYPGTSSYHGGEGDDEIFASNMDNVITGGEGGDGLRAYGGDDTIDGGGGADGGAGGYGNDTCTGVEVPVYCSQDGSNDDLVGEAPTEGPSADLSIKIRFKERQRDGDSVYIASVANQGPDPGQPTVFMSFFGTVESVGNSGCAISSTYPGDVDCSLDEITAGTTRNVQVVVDDPQLGGRSANVTDARSGESTVRDPDWSNNNLGAPDATTEALPIVFVPGFLGSEIKCGDQELWPNLPNPRFDLMKLESDGVTNSQADPCSAQAGASGKILEEDYAYGPAAAFLRSLPRKVFFYGYDWRKSPLLAVDGLDDRVDTALSRAGTDKVVLMAHSMGGLVARAYIDRFASKVARVVTVGTPYLGAPLPWTALAHGYTDPESNILDAAIDNDDLKAFAQNATGAYYLYPSQQFVTQIGPWLTYPPVGGTTPLTAAQVLTAVDAFGGNSTLLQLSYNDHAALLETYPTTVEWQMVVSSAVETLLKVDETDPDDPTFVYGNGDGTVPVVSAGMGLIEPGAVHYVCGVTHGAMAGADKVTSIIKAYLLKGDPVTGRTSRCNIP